MKEDNKSYLRKNDYFQNNMALENLLEFGRNNLKDDDFYNKQIEKIEELTNEKNEADYEYEED